MEAEASESRAPVIITGGILLLGAAAVRWPLLSPLAAVATLIAFLVVSRAAPRALRAHYLALGAAALLSTFAFVQFLRTEAIAGIVEGGTRATETRAVSRLREILFAEDVMRRKPELDHDDDGVGSAALVAELTAELGLRGERRLNPPLLERYGKTDPTAIGPAHDLGGFFFVVCLPTVGGGFSAEPKARVDEEAAERRFLAYAWPSSDRAGLAQAYFLDEHERILV
ncbi:MAG TPA: hypothetical protein VM686_23065, partial [Polyangiaceae bacterium]|nr:hypothetical protein [Polyangiaceae bacterium]